MLHDTRVTNHAVYRHSHTRLSLSLAILSRIVLLVYILTCQTLHYLNIYPHDTTYTTHASLHIYGLGYSRFAHHYSGNHFVFFSWHYLDVSVHAVCLCILCIQIQILWFFHRGFPHSEISGSQFIYKLPEAYRML